MLWKKSAIATYIFAIIFCEFFYLSLGCFGFASRQNISKKIRLAIRKFGMFIRVITFFTVWNIVIASTLSVTYTCYKISSTYVTFIPFLSRISIFKIRTLKSTKSTISQKMFWIFTAIQIKKFSNDLLS